MTTANLRPRPRLMEVTQCIWSGWETPLWVEVEEVTLACTVYLTDMERVWWEVVKEAQFTNRWNNVAPSAVKLAKSLSIRVKNIHPCSLSGFLKPQSWYFHLRV